MISVYYFDLADYFNDHHVLDVSTWIIHESRLP